MRVGSCVDPSLRAGYVQGIECSREPVRNSPTNAMPIDKMLTEFNLTGTHSGLEFEVRLDPGRRVYCLVGENGAGKTSLLEELARVLWWRHALWRGNGGQPRSFAGLHRHHPLREQIGERSLRVPNIRAGEVELKGAGQAWGFTPLLDAPPLAVPGTAVLDCPFVFVSAKARAEISNIVSTALELVGDTTTVFCSALQRGLDAAEGKPTPSATASAWLASRLIVNPAFVVGYRPPMHEVRALLELLQRFDAQSFPQLVAVDGPNVGLDVAFQDGKLFLAKMPIDHLPSGYAALVKILQELVSSLAAWEAMRGSTEILGSDALVFIDEIDAHLHPRWQRQLIPFLKASFPNATFVVTTHSPLVVRDTEAGEAYELVRTGKEVRSRRLGSRETGT